MAGAFDISHSLHHPEAIFRNTKYTVIWVTGQEVDETQLKGPGTGAGASRKNVRVVPWGDEQVVVDGVAP